MATIAQRELFSWKEIEELGDLERLRLVLDHLPDEPLMEVLEAERGVRGRDDYPVRAVWNSLLAGIIYGHESVESLRREMGRNTRLVWLCGFERHFIRGLAKMKLRMGLAMVVMLSMAVGRIKEKQREDMCSLVKAAA